METFMSLTNPKLSEIRNALLSHEESLSLHIYSQSLDIANESSASCQQLVKCIVELLTRDSHKVKLKVVKLIKHLAQNGGSEVIFYIRFHSHVIQSIASQSVPRNIYSSPSHYLLVQMTTAAKELLEVLYAENVNPVSHDIQQMKSLSLTGMGQNVGMRGFGNSPMPSEGGITDKILSKLSTLSNNSTTDSASNEVIVKTPLSTRNESLYMSSVNATNKHKLKGRKHIPGRPGGGWADDDDDEIDVDENNYLSSKTERNITHDEDSESNWSIEQGIVEDFVSRNRFLLTYADLQDFLNRCSACNGNRVMHFISEQLSTSLVSNTNDVMRGLQLLECLMNTDLIDVDMIANNYCHVVLDCYKRGPEAVMYKAKKILLILERLCDTSLLDSTNSDNRYDDLADKTDHNISRPTLHQT